MAISLKSMILPCFILAACGGETPDNSAPPATQAIATPQSVASTTPVDPLVLGKRVYKKCQACHTLTENGKHKVGPNMWDVYGSTAGTKDSFAYSKAMKDSGVIWTEETMDAYLTKPREFMPGNRMTFVGLKKKEDRDAVQAYIKSQTTPSE